jgi:hypothetical protein
MGRYYSGDIHGKFWFGLQSSDAATRFGGQMYEPQYVEFYFEEDDLEGIESEVERIEKALGDKVKTINCLFEANNSYRDEDLEAIGISRADLSEYADLELGIKIRNQVRDFGECRFDAEL